jgi:hypothetical protein
MVRDDSHTNASAPAPRQGEAPLLAFVSSVMDEELQRARDRVVQERTAWHAFGRAEWDVARRSAGESVRFAARKSPQVDRQSARR